jgi:hypothetical protein
METAVKRTTIVCLSLIFISLMLAFQSVAKVDPKSAVAVWLFDEGKGDTAEDFTGNGNDGKLMNGSKWVEGKFGKALEFNGTNNYVEVSQPKGLPIGSAARTVSLWFKWSDIRWPCPAIQIMGYGANVSGQRLGLTIECSPHGLGIETCLFARTFSWDGDTNWHHLAVAYPEGETTTSGFKIYFDGVLQKAEDRAAPQKLNTTGAPLTIGVLPQALVYYFNGAVDDIAVFDEELSGNDIKDFAKWGLLNASVSPSGKIAISWGRIKAQ